MNNLKSFSNELLVQRNGQGVSLVRPDKRIKSNESLHSVGDLMQLPINCYLLNTESQILEVNEKSAAICGFTSTKDALKLTVEHYASKETAHKILHNDKKVICNKQFDMTEDTLTRFDEKEFTGITFRLPWIQDNKIVGLLGLGIVYSCHDMHYLTHNLLRLGQMGLIGHGAMQAPDKVLSGRMVDDIYLNKRELEILNLLAAKNTAKKIGKIIGISNRTVEHHIESCRAKTRTNSKAELLDWSLRNATIISVQSN